MKFKNYYIDLVKSSDYEVLLELLNVLEHLGLDYNLVSHYQIDYRTRKPKLFLDAPSWIRHVVSRQPIYESPRKLPRECLDFICNSLTIKVDVTELNDNDLSVLNEFVERFIKERFS